MKVNPVFTTDDGSVDKKTLDEIKNELTIEEAQPQAENKKQEKKKEKWYMKLIQIVVPFFIAGFGMVGAGVLFNEVQNWEVFVNVSEIIILVPALLGLKGNLDMSLASRLSTQINLGEVHNKETIIQAVTGNVILKLLQAIVVGFLTSFIACLTEYILNKTFRPESLLTLIASSVTSAAITSVVLGLIVMAIILISNKLKINPDNVATPMAGSIGDVGTLITLAGIGSFFYTYKEKFWIHLIFIVFFLSLIPFLIYFSKKNPFVKSTLKQGWTPVLISMLISSVSGKVLKEAVESYIGIESYQPVINGVGGNLVSIYASRLSTEIARDPSSYGSWVKWAPRRFYSFPYHTFFGKENPEAKTSHILMLLVLPGHIVFFFVIYFVTDSESQPKLTVWLVLFYLIAASIQITLLFFICYYIVHLVWRFKFNPDDYCIPLLTALGDIFGALLLYLCFYLVYLSGDESIKVTKEPPMALNSTSTLFMYIN